MRTREYALAYQHDVGTAGTITFNLDFSSPITQIDIMFGGTNGGTSNLDNPLERNVSKIEIVDGGEVLWDLPGDVALAVYAQENEGMPNNYRTEVANDGPYQGIPIRFGREMYDTIFAFNPIAHKNPQLKVTLNEATVRAAGATGYVSDSITLDVTVYLMEDAPAPVGFLSWRDIYQYTSLASGDTRVELPTDRVIRQLAMRAYEAEKDMRASVTNLRLSGDGGKFVPFDLGMGTLISRMAAMFDPIMVTATDLLTDATRTETWVGIDIMGSAISGEDDDIIGANTFWPGSLYPYVFSHAGADGTNVPAHVCITGWCVHNTYQHPFGLLTDLSQWFNPNPFRQLDLFLTNGDAGAEVNICIQQLYTY